MRRTLVVSYLVSATALLGACTGSDEPQDTTQDASDSGGSDSGGSDSSEPDSGEPDSSEPDSGEPDSSEPDSGEPDSSEPDSGTTTGPGHGTEISLPPVGTRTLYRVDRCDGNTFDAPGLYNTDVEIDGETWARIELGDFSVVSPEGVIVFARYVSGLLEFKGAEVYTADGPGPAFAYSLADPIGGTDTTEAGEPVTIETTAVLCFGEDCSPVDVTIVYEIVSKSATVDVPYGTIENAWQIRFQISEGGMELPESDWFVSDGLGLLSAGMIPGYCSIELVELTPPG